MVETSASLTSHHRCYKLQQCMLTEENIDMSIAPVFLLYSIYIHISIHSYLYLFLLFSTDQADD